MGSMKSILIHDTTSSTLDKGKVSAIPAAATNANQSKLSDSSSTAASVSASSKNTTPSQVTEQLIADFGPVRAQAGCYSGSWWQLPSSSMGGDSSLESISLSLEPSTWRAAWCPQKNKSGHHEVVLQACQSIRGTLTTRSGSVRLVGDCWACFLYPRDRHIFGFWSELPTIPAARVLLRTVGPALSGEAPPPSRFYGVLSQLGPQGQSLRGYLARQGDDAMAPPVGRFKCMLPRSDTANSNETAPTEHQTGPLILEQVLDKYWPMSYFYRLYVPAPSELPPDSRYELDIHSGHALRPVEGHPDMLCDQCGSKNAPRYLSCGVCDFHVCASCFAYLGGEEPQPLPPPLPNPLVISKDRTTTDSAELARRNAMQEHYFNRTVLFTLSLYDQSSYVYLDSNLLALACSYLSPDDLLVVREVSKHWSEASQSKIAWSASHMSFDDDMWNCKKIRGQRFFEFHSRTSPQLRSIIMPGAYQGYGDYHRMPTDVRASLSNFRSLQRIVYRTEDPFLDASVLSQMDQLRTLELRDGCPDGNNHTALKPGLVLPQIKRFVVGSGFDLPAGDDDLVSFIFKAQMANSLVSLSIREDYVAGANFAPLKVLEELIIRNGYHDRKYDGVEWKAGLESIPTLGKLRLLQIEDMVDIDVSELATLFSRPAFNAQIEYLAFPALHVSCTLMYRVLCEFTQLLVLHLTDVCHKLEKNDPDVLAPITEQQWQQHIATRGELVSSFDPAKPDWSSSVKAADLSSCNRLDLMFWLTAPQPFRERLLSLQLGPVHEGSINISFLPIEVSANLYARFANLLVFSDRTGDNKHTDIHPNWCVGSEQSTHDSMQQHCPWLLPKPMPARWQTPKPDWKDDAVTVSFYAPPIQQLRGLKLLARHELTISEQDPALTTPWPVAKSSYGDEQD